MYVPHPLIKNKFSDGATIWRYTTLDAFIWTLIEHKLNFTRSDMFEDEFEGTYALRNSLEFIGDDQPVIPGLALTVGEVRKELRKSSPDTRKCMYVNCWHASECESAAMWKIYSSRGDGVAIKTTVGKLKECFKNAEKEIVIGSVDYVDYGSFIIPEGNALIPFMYKRMSFEHERELRALVFDQGNIVGGDAQAGFCERQRENFDVPVDLEILIQGVYVAPGRPKWFVETVKAVCARFGVEVDVISGMSERPVLH